MRMCSDCGSNMIVTEEPCIFCKGEICDICRNSHGKSTIVTCTNKKCKWGDIENE